MSIGKKKARKKNSRPIYRAFHQQQQQTSFFSSVNVLIYIVRNEKKKFKNFQNAKKIYTFFYKGEKKISNENENEKQTTNRMIRSKNDIKINQSINQLNIEKRTQENNLFRHTHTHTDRNVCFVFLLSKKFCGHMIYRSNDDDDHHHRNKIESSCLSIYFGCIFFLLLRFFLIFDDDDEFESMINK